MKNRFMRILSILVTLSLLLGTTVFTNVRAAPASSEAVTAPAILREETSLREENVKHFRLNDGTYMAALYAEPVHFLNGAGEWQEIDSTLSLNNSKRSAADKATYTPAAAGLDIRVPQDFTGGQKLTISKNGFTVGMSVKEQSVTENTQQALDQTEENAVALSAMAEVNNDLEAVESISVSQSQGTTQQVQADNEQQMLVSDLSSSVTYRDIFSGADLEYIISSGQIKENIRVKEPQQEYLYRFDLSLTGLTPVPQENGSIFLLENAQDAEPLFVLNAPYMYDAAGAESTDLSMSLAEDGTLTLNANTAWVNAEDRAFPVCIDPTITVASGFQDAYISTAAKGTNYNINVENYIGDALLGTRRTYLYFPLPTVPTHSFIQNASLRVKQTNSDYSPAGLYLNAYVIPASASWSASSVTWNNQPLSTNINGPHQAGTPIAATVLISNNNGDYTLNITNTVSSWYANNSNKGLMFATSNESTRGQIRIASVRNLNSSNRPTATIVYAPPSVSAVSWDMDAQAATSDPITVICGTSWTAVPNQSWLTVSNGNSSTFTISAAANADTSERTGTVTVQAANGAAIGAITVTQLGAEPVPLTPEVAMIYEASAIGLAHYNSIKNDTTFAYDPGTNYGELLEDNGLQLRFANFVSSLELGNLQTLSDLLTEAEYSAADVNLFVDRWAVAFARMDLMDIWWTVFSSGSELDMDLLFVPIAEQSPLEDAEGMLTAVFDYYYDSIFTGFFELISNDLSQNAFNMDYMEALELHYDTQPWEDFEKTVDEYWSFVSYSFEWTVASYLKNLAAMNGIFDEFGMVREAMGIGLFEGMENSLGASFRYNPNKAYGDFGAAMSGATGVDVDFLSNILGSNMGNAASLRTALTDADYSQAQAAAFVQRMAEVFSYQSLQSIKNIFASENPQAAIASMLTTSALAADMDDMVGVMLTYFDGILSGIPVDNSGGDETNGEESEEDPDSEEDPIDYINLASMWVLSSYLQNFAVLNDIVIPSGSITPDVFPIKNYALKEDITRTAITIGFAEAQKIDVSEVAVDETAMQTLLDSILAQDIADLGVMLHGVLLRKGVAAEDLLVTALLSLILNGDSEGLDEVALANVLRTATSVPLEEVFAELEEMESFAGDELGSDDMGAAAGRVLTNLINYLLEGWEAIGQEVGALFDEDDETLDHVLAWVTTLYVKNLAALNAEEIPMDMGKASVAVSKQERLENEATAKQLVTKSDMDTVVDSFGLDSLEIYDTIDVDDVLDSYYSGELDAAQLMENAEFVDAVFEPVRAASELLANLADEYAEELPIAETVLRTASEAMSTSSACPTECNCNSCVEGCTPDGSVRLTYLEGGTNVKRGTPIKLKLSTDYLSGVSVEWTVEQLSDGDTPVLTLASPTNTDFTVSYRTTSIGRVKITANVVVVTEDETIEYERTTFVKVTEMDPIDALFLNSNGSLKSTTDYNHPLASFSMYLSYASANSAAGLHETGLAPLDIPPSVIPGYFMTIGDKIEDVLKVQGFKDISQKHYNNQLLPNRAGYTLAYRNISVNGKPKTLVTVVVRGSTATVEWLTNGITISEAAGMKAGFHAASKDMRRHLDRYIGFYSILGRIKNDPIALVTGHSLGGATANLLADDLTRDAKWGQAKVYAYAFATPTVAYKSGTWSFRDVANPHENVFNILNSCNDIDHVGKEIITICCDLVTHVPGRIMEQMFFDDPWSRHGREVCVKMEPYPPIDPAPVNPPTSLPLLEFIAIFLGNNNQSLTGDELLGIVGGNHKMGTYLHWMEELPGILGKQPEDITWADIVDFSNGTFTT